MEEQKRLVETLRKEPGHLGHVLRGRARRDNRRLMLFVDQFEELFTMTADPAERAAFMASRAEDQARAPRPSISTTVAPSSMRGICGR